MLAMDHILQPENKSRSQPENKSRSQPENKSRSQPENKSRSQPPIPPASAVTKHERVSQLSKTTPPGPLRAPVLLMSDSTKASFQESRANLLSSMVPNNASTLPEAESQRPVVRLSSSIGSVPAQNWSSNAQSEQRRDNLMGAIPPLSVNVNMDQMPAEAPMAFTGRHVHHPLETRPAKRRKVSADGRVAPSQRQDGFLGAISPSGRFFASKSRKATPLTDSIWRMKAQDSVSEQGNPQITTTHKQVHGDQDRHNSSKSSDLPPKNALQSKGLEDYKRGSTLATAQTVPVSIRQQEVHEVKDVHAMPNTTRRIRHQIGGGFSEEENHLLIFLKEVEKLSWRDITIEYARYAPERKYHNLQTHYSSRLNKRDRSLDPPVLILPADLALQSTAKWPAVRQQNSGPNVKNNVKHAVHEGPRYSAASPMIESANKVNQQDPRHERPQRAVPRIDYTLPKQLSANLEDEDFFGTVADNSDDMKIDMQEQEDEHLGQTNKITSLVSDSRKDAGIALSLQSNQSADPLDALPYCSRAQRQTFQRVSHHLEWNSRGSACWQGSIVHVDFCPAEVDSVFQRVQAVLRTSPVKTAKRPSLLRKLLQNISEPTLLRLSRSLLRDLPKRDLKSIDAFLEDAKAGFLSKMARIQRLATARPDRTFSTPPTSITTISMLRQRELGLQAWQGRETSSRPISYQTQNKLHDTLGVTHSYTGASSDVHTVAWSNDGGCFAAGAICVDDNDSQQYNRSKNLLYGNLCNRTIFELGEHRVPRLRTASGPNSTHAMHASQDPYLYQTVSCVAFSPNPNLPFMYSAGYDKTVRVWDIDSDGQPHHVMALTHRASVDMVALNRSGLLATAAKKTSSDRNDSSAGESRRKTGPNPIKVVRVSPEIAYGGDIEMQSFNSMKATNSPDLKILPTALQFSPRHENMLLAGFGANFRGDGRDITGDICLWDVNAESFASSSSRQIHGSSRNVFDLSFHPRYTLFAVGCVAAGNVVNRGTRSAVRIYSESGPSKHSLSCELECKAYDMNDVVWCPGDDNLLAVGCTSGRIYVWDVRRPDTHLGELRHGPSLMPLDDDISHEFTDTGVRFLSWGDNATRLYSGSSDGILKVWDVTQSPEGMFVKDLFSAKSGIMSGAFSPDFSRLAIGEVNGSVNILDVGNDDTSMQDVQGFRFSAYKTMSSMTTNGNDSTIASNSTRTNPVDDAHSGIARAAELVVSGQMRIVPSVQLPIHLAIQGPNYCGPYDTHEDAPALRALAMKVFSNDGNQDRRPHNKCTLPSCIAKSTTRITEEEAGDSQRSQDRIPDELRVQWHAKHGRQNRQIVTGRAQCARCGRAARADEDATGTGKESTAAPLCERCAFACFRCGASTGVKPHTEFLECDQCGGVWDIGALGYYHVQESQLGREGDSASTLLRRLTRKSTWRHVEAAGKEDDASFGDEMNALTEYYLGLGI